jgi:biotin carboxyl carrier protein
LIGRVHDYARKLLAEVVAPDDGIVLHVLVTPPVKAGETLVALARPSISN